MGCHKQSIITSYYAFLDVWSSAMVSLWQSGLNFYRDVRFFIYIYIFIYFFDFLYRTSLSLADPQSSAVVTVTKLHFSPLSLFPSQTMAWLSRYGICNVRTDVDACDCTRGLYGQRKRVCSESCLWVKIKKNKKKIKKCRTWDSNPRQYCAWLFNRTLYQLSHSLVFVWFWRGGKS